MKCFYCDKEINDRDLICPYCGKPTGISNVQETEDRLSSMKSPSKLTKIVGIVALVAILAISAVTYSHYVKSTNYKNALASIETGDYSSAINSLTDLGKYKDAPEKLKEAQYLQAKQLYNIGEYEQAYHIFDSLADYEDSKEMVKACQYESGCNSYENGAYDTAHTIFEQLGDYRDSKEMLSQTDFQRAEVLFYDGLFEEAYTLYEGITGSDKQYAVRRIHSIECESVADNITDELLSWYGKDEQMYNSYLGLFGMEMKFDYRYDIWSYTYHYNLYIPELYSAFISSVGFSLSDLYELDPEGKGERSIYEKFYNAGFGDITCVTNIYDHRGNWICAYEYTETDYLNDNPPKEYHPNENNDIPNSETSSVIPSTPDNIESISTYPIQINMDDLMSANILGDTFWSAYESGWIEEWMSLYVNGSSDPNSSFEPFWYDNQLGEWTYYGITYSQADTAGWGDVWTEILSRAVG